MALKVKTTRISNFETKWLTWKNVSHPLRTILRIYFRRLPEFEYPQKSIFYFCFYIFDEKNRKWIWYVATLKSQVQKKKLQKKSKKKNLKNQKYGYHHQI